MAIFPSHLMLYNFWKLKQHCMMKFSWAMSQVKWLSGEKDHCFEDHLCPRPQGTSLITSQPFDLADSPRELHHTQLPGKQ
jgi:hypothetical protein